MIQKLLLLNGAILTGCAFFIPESLLWLITALLFFLPLIDRTWLLNRQLVGLGYFFKSSLYIWIVISFSFLALLLLNEGYELIALNIILFTALPEEWFFRAYFMQRLETFIDNKWIANGVASSLFTLLHIPTQGVMGLAVFIPSLVFGYVYQRSKNLLLVVMLHALFNLVYLVYIRVL